MKRTLGLVAATALASAAFGSQAEAAPVITVDPANQNVAAGGSVTVDIDVSGLSSASLVGGIEFDLGFNSTLLKGLSYSIDPAGAMGGAYNAKYDYSGGFGVDYSGKPFSGLDVVYLPVSPKATLDAEGTGFTLAAITFTASNVNTGISPLTLSDFVLSESDGSTAIPGVTAVDGQICVGGNCAHKAPEIDPAGAFGAMTLLAGGLAAMRGRRIQKVDAK